MNNEKKNILFTAFHLLFISDFVLQEVCVLQYPSDSVQKPVGPNNDVQKHDTITFPEVLPGCVVICFFSSVITFIITAKCLHMISYFFFFFFTDDGDRVLVDVEGKEHRQIAEHVKKILGKSE